MEHLERRDTTKAQEPLLPAFADPPLRSNFQFCIDFWASVEKCVYLRVPFWSACAGSLSRFFFLRLEGSYIYWKPKFLRRI
jgi:hypothetical protein